MSEKSFEAFLAELFEGDLQEFLSIPTIERLEKAKELFSWNNSKLKLVFEKYSDFILQDLEGKTDEEKQNYLSSSENDFKSYLKRKYEDILPTLPYFLWASHLVFDETYSQLTFDAKEELRNHSDLDTRGKRKETFTDFFAKFIDEKVVDGGSQSYWNEWTRMYFLAHYERLSIVIENARNDIKILKKQKIPAMEIKKEITDKYRTPEDQWNDLFRKTRKDAIARKWASDIIKRNFHRKYIQEMGFADSYLIKVLKRQEKMRRNTYFVVAKIIIITNLYLWF